MTVVHVMYVLGYVLHIFRTDACALAKETVVSRNRTQEPEAMLNYDLSSSELQNVLSKHISIRRMRTRKRESVPDPTHWRLEEQLRMRGA